MWGFVVDRGDLAGACGGAFDRRVADVPGQTFAYKVTHDDRVKAESDGRSAANQRLHCLAAIANHDGLLVDKELPQEVFALLISDERAGRINVPLRQFTGDDLPLPLGVQEIVDCLNVVLFGQLGVDVNRSLDVELMAKDVGLANVAPPVLDPPEPDLVVQNLGS